MLFCKILDVGYIIRSFLRGSISCLILILVTKLKLKQRVVYMQIGQNYFQLHSPALLNALKNRQAFFDRLEPDHLERALKFQELIDEKLKKAGNQNNRLTIINQMMMDSLRELHKLLGELPRPH